MEETEPLGYLQGSMGDEVQRLDDCIWTGLLLNGMVGWHAVSVVDSRLASDQLAASTEL